MSEQDGGAQADDLACDCRLDRTAALQAAFDRGDRAGRSLAGDADRDALTAQVAALTSERDEARAQLRMLREAIHLYVQSGMWPERKVVENLAVALALTTPAPADADREG